MRLSPATSLCSTLLAGLVAAGLATAAPARTWTVTTPSSVGSAVSAAGEGDTVIVHEGVYNEAGIAIDKRLTLLGVGFPVIDGQERGDVIIVRADGTHIEGLEIRNVGISYIDDRAAIRLVEVSDCVLLNNRLTNAFFGIYADKSTGCRISGNRIAGVRSRETTSGNGIHLWYCHDMRIERNNITGHRDGIYLEFVENSVISDNVSENNLRYGLHFMFSHRDRYEGNVFRHNGAGVAVMYSDYVTMTRNTFQHNWGPSSYGLLLKDIRDSEITDNRFHRNTIGLYSEGSMRMNVNGNAFESNGYAMKILASSSDNRITNNNFISNTFDVSTNSRQNFNEFNGNYWSRYQGYDLDRDGIGDVPYRPVHLFSLLVERQPAGLILLRSFFIDLIDAAEQIMPVYTPPTLLDRRPFIDPLALRGEQR